MKKTLLTSALLVLLQAGPALAADDCNDAQDNASLKQCVHDAYASSDAELNKQFSQIKNRLEDNADAAKQLVSAQRAWIAYRDAECDFASSGVEGGSIHSVIATQCRDSLTQKRIVDFNGYLSCEEGDLGCPVPTEQ